MRRTISQTPSAHATMVEYYDRNQAQRWGKVKREGADWLLVVGAVGEEEVVPKEKVIRKTDMVK